MEEYVILVDSDDRRIGSAEKLVAHRRGLLHRAFSIFIFNPSGDLLLQRRNPGKYHCGNLWSNTCCSHPRPGESMNAAIHRRLREELGFDCRLFHAGSFMYRAGFENGLIENEIDHVYYGYYDGEIAHNEKEILSYKWVSQHDLRVDLESNGENYTPWMKPAMELVTDTTLEPSNIRR